MWPYGSSSELIFNDRFSSRCRVDTFSRGKRPRGADDDDKERRGQRTTSENGMRTNRTRGTANSQVGSIAPHDLLVWQDDNAQDEGQAPVDEEGGATRGETRYEIHNFFSPP